MGPSLPNTFTEATRLLRPRAVGIEPLRIRALALLLEGQQSALDATLQIAPGVALGAYLDLPTADVPVTDSMLAQWGVTLPQVLDVARSNVADDNANIQLIDGAYLVEGAGFAVAALVDPGIATQIVRGQAPLMVTVGMGSTIIVPAFDENAVAVLVQIASAILDTEQRPVSVTPLVAGASGWEIAHLPASAGALTAKLQRQWNNARYAEQRELVQRRLASHGFEAFVAESVLVGNDKGDTMSYCTVTEEVDTVIPVTDNVMLSPVQGAPVQVPFAQFAQVPGLLVSVAESPVALYHVERFPAELLNNGGNV